MKVVLDTNAIVADFRLGSEPFRVLFAHLRSLSLSLSVPELVISEAVTKYREALEEKETQLRSRTDDIARMLGVRGDQLLAALPPINESVVAYEEFLRGELIKHGATFLPIPAIAHTDIVARELQRKKPFNSKKGSGYRDFLIWTSVVNLARDGEVVSLITNNTHDFADGDEANLHPDLRADLGTGQSVLLHRTVHDFNRTEITPSLEKLNEERAQLQNGTHAWFDLRQWTLEAIPGLLGTDDLLQFANNASDGAEIDTVEIDETKLLAVAVNDLSRMRDGDSVAEITATLEFKLRGYEIRRELRAWKDRHLPPVRDLHTFTLVADVSFSLILPNDRDAASATAYIAQLKPLRSEHRFIGH